jgi:hypothetical protein
MATKNTKKEKYKMLRFRRSPKRTPKLKFFPTLFDFARFFFFLKGMEKFSVLGRKFLQNLRAEAGRRLSGILKESSSAVVNPHQHQTFRNFCGFFFGDLQKSPLFLRGCVRLARGQDEVRLPCDLKCCSVFALPKRTKRIFAYFKVVIY